MPGSSGRSRSLRDNAVPTIFSHTKSANERPASERRKGKACHEKVSAALILIRRESDCIKREIKYHFNWTDCTIL